MFPRTLLRASGTARAIPSRVYPTQTAFKPNTLSSARYYADQPSAAPKVHPTEPHTPPKPDAFFAMKNIGLEVTPLMVFIGTIALVATGALVRNLISDPDIHSRHGVENDDKLKQVLAMPDEKKGEKKGEKKASETEKK
ncbi:hypothetical protein JCM16303_002226 [Sporobolomyces ruberrimus]